MNYQLGDFDGITYTEADFHYPGQSGFEGISYNDGDFHTPGTSGFGGFVSSTKNFIVENQVPIIAVAILAIGLMAMKEDKKA